MAEKPDQDQKTEAPSPKRRRDAVDKGDILQSRELATALVMAAGAGWLILAGPWFVDSLRLLLVRGLSLSRDDLLGFDPWTRTIDIASATAAPFATLCAVTLAAAAAGPAVLGSLGFRPKAFAPKASKLNPLTGLSRIFGMQGLTELGKSLAKVVLVGTVGFGLLMADWPEILGLAVVDVRRAAGASGSLVVSLTIWMAAALVIIGIIDIPIQFVQRLSRLRMTKEEVKQEHKDSEGSPETKAMARQHRHEILSGSARRAVTDATVVLTNPTHFAVALRYRPEKDAVPMVVARGRGETAQAIKALAREAAVPQLEYPQLTRAIYFTTRAGQPISSDLYLAVATILAFVFNLDRATAEGMVQPDIAIPPAKRFDERGKRFDR